MSAISRRKGAGYERELVHRFREAMPGAEVRRGLQSRGGSEAADVECPRFWLEAKRGRQPNIRGALRQARADAPEGRVPIAVVRDDRAASTVTLLLDDFLAIVREWWLHTGGEMRVERICRIAEDGTQTPMALVPAEPGGVTLSADSVRVICEVLDVAAGFLKGAGDGLRNSCEYARGLLMPATMFHDAGAAAQCRACQRYTSDLRALRPAGDPSCATCNCGEILYWTGSFPAPTRDSKWSLP